MPDHNSSTFHLQNSDVLELVVNVTDTQLNNISFGREEKEIEYYYFYRTEQLGFLWILFTMIVAGNGSVMVTLMLSKNRKSRMNFFIMQLALADLLVGLVQVLTDIVWRTFVDFYGGNVICKMVRYFQVLVMYSSTYVLVALSIDRYDAITHPLRFSGSWKRAKILIGSAWGLSALAASPAVFLNKESLIKGRLQCWIDMENWQWRLYMPLVAASVFFLPAIVISMCYTVIVYTIWTKSKSLSYTKSKGSTFILKDNSGRFIDDEEAGSRRASSRGVIPRAKIKTVKMTFVIVFVFILCWSPYFIYDLLQVFGYFPLNQTTIAISTFIQSLAPLNSAANPFIYFIFSTHLCRTLSNFSCCQWFSRHSRACYSKTKRPTESDSRTSRYTTISEIFLRSTRLSTTVSLETQPSVSDAMKQVTKKTINEKRRKIPSETLETTPDKIHL